MKANPPTFKVEPLAIDKFAQADATLTVTVNPPSMKTSSPATGTLAPLAPPELADHVVVTLQLPVATEYRGAPVTLRVPSKKSIVRAKILQPGNCLII